MRQIDNMTDTEIETLHLKGMLAKPLAQTKVTIVVDGGNVQGVFSNDPAIQVTLIDHDNLREEHDSTERENIELDAVHGLREIIIQ